MSCQYCGSDKCGSSAGGSEMCEDAEKKPVSERKDYHQEVRQENEEWWKRFKERN
jgi:hypothetical protein